MRSPGLSGSFWPTERQVLLLRAALLYGERADAAWLQLQPGFRLDELDTPAVALLPLVQRRAGELPIDEELRSRLRGIHRHAWYVNNLRLERLSRVVGLLADVGGDPLVVSSFELPLLYYRDLGSRPVAALNVLVEPATEAAASRALVEDGWVQVDRTAAATQFRRGDDHCLVFRRLFRDFAGGTDQARDDLRRLAVPLSLNGEQAQALGPADELVHLCIEGAKPKRSHSAMWAADASVVVGTAGPELDWDRVVAQAHRLGATLRLRDALSFVRRALDVPVPPGVLEALTRVPTRRRERLAHAAAASSLAALGPPPESLTRFLRVTADRSVPSALRALPAFLQDEWELERPSQLPLHAARKGAVRLAAARRHASPAGTRQ
jgi:Uncharacterised nucleotidyltransferase